jgi:hypothetical protein
VVGPDEAALDAEHEAVGALEPQEVGRDRRQLPQHHLPVSSPRLSGGGSRGRSFESKGSERVWIGC